MRGLAAGSLPNVAYGRTCPMPNGGSALRYRAYAAEHGPPAAGQHAAGPILFRRDYRGTLLRGGYRVANPAHQEASVGEVLATTRLQEEASGGMPRTGATATSRGCPGLLEQS